MWRLYQLNSFIRWTLKHILYIIGIEQQNSVHLEK